MIQNAEMYALKVIIEGLPVVKTLQRAGAAGGENMREFTVRRGIWVSF